MFLHHGQPAINVWQAFGELLLINANVISAYPIIEFNSDGGNPRFRGWESGTSVWVDLGLPGGFAYDTWVELSIKLRSDGEFQYKVGNLVYTTTTSSGDGSVKLANTILQGHNNNPGVTYDIYWDDLASNTVSLFTNTVTGCGTADLTTAAVTSGSVLPGGTTLGYFTDQACAFSVPDATQVGAGPYYIRATAPGGCFEVQPVTVTIQAAPTATIAYSAATYTTADPAQSVNITGTPNTGTFSAPAGLSINAATGQITPSTSTPGSYVVTYTVAASGVCPLYTTTTNVTINLFVPALFDCATPLDFSSAVALSPTQAPNVWYTDRYAPNGFAISNDLGGSTLKHSINAADGQPGTALPIIGFYNTQGRKYDLEANSASLKIKLYVPASWASSGRRMAGLWGTAFDNTNNVSGYPIIEFSANSEGTGVPRFRCYETGSGAWVDLGLPAGFVYDSWVEMSIKLRSDGEFQYKVGNLVYTTTTGSGDGSVKIANVILQGYNLTTGVTYDIYWDDLASNTVSLIVTNPTGACPSVSLTASAVTALSKMPLGTTLSYFTNPACTFSVPDATQVGSGTYYIKATAPGGCFDVEPVTVSLRDQFIT
ncbi:MAG: hypothetical protein IPO68_10450 [Chitinophagaceae bacterium]|nr:hypothetical protein [Chitinophagaceae bacterium]